MFNENLSSRSDDGKGKGGSGTMSLGPGLGVPRSIQRAGPTSRHQMTQITSDHASDVSHFGGFELPRFVPPRAAPAGAERDATHKSLTYTHHTAITPRSLVPVVESAAPFKNHLKTPSRFYGAIRADSKNVHIL